MYSRTTEYYDDVLGAKMRSLVSGAIKRAKLEKAEPTITYEGFVEDLDRGDSFTTSLIEVLVKEVAERRYRHHAADRGLIGDRTARSLRKLSSPSSVYRERAPGRGPGARRGVDLAEYLSQPPDELDVDEDDDELGPYGTFVPVIEGSRLNTDLYDAYRSQHSWSNSSTPYFLSFPHTSPPMSSAPPPDAGSDRILPPLVDTSPPTRTTVWPHSSSGGFLHSNLSRQPSIRRPGRNRISDFSEFTTARRNSTRQLAPDEDHNVRSEPPAPNNVELPATSSLGPRSSSVQARRFFPFGRTRRFEIIPTPRPAASMSDDWYFPPHSGWATNPSERIGGGEEPAEERSQAPRLRRGGLRAPESLLSRHTSPPIGVPSIAFPTPEELQHVTTAAAAAMPAGAAPATVVTDNSNLVAGEGARPVEERVQ
ncbi:hypothetical protein J3R83DRAFT_1261 [Lanmaoa asiatica]|nr:hypothetical protein J3R83DRAFT_1261 [Lanmaoa asiatica]